MERLSLVVWGISCLVQGCVGAPSGEEASGRICTDHEETGYPSVGQLLTPKGMCTASLISDSVVVSAKHCIRPDTNPWDVYFVAGGQSARGIGLYYREGFPANEGIIPENDVLFVAIDRSLPGVPALPPQFYPGPELAPGATIFLVGFGEQCHVQGTAGVKRSGFTTVKSVSSDSPVFLAERRLDPPPGTIPEVGSGPGDSGGPVLLGGQVVGILNGSGGDTLSQLTQIRDYRDVFGCAQEAVGNRNRGEPPPASLWECWCEANAPDSPLCQ